MNKPKVILHIECLEPEAREKAKTMVKKFAEMPREEVRKVFPKVMLMNPYDEKLYYVLFSLFGDYDKGLEKIALYFGVDTPFITKAKEALADRLFTENLRQELAKSEQAALSAKAEYERVLESNGVEDTQSARKNLGTIEARLNVYDEKARTIEGEILVARDKVNEARNIIAEVEHFIYRSDYSQS